jgi:hypothetical protein
MRRASWVSAERRVSTSRHAVSPDTGGVYEDYDGERSCRSCEKLVHEDGRFRCQLGILDRTYRGIASLKSPYPSEVAARCTSYTQRDGRFGKEG